MSRLSLRAIAALKREASRCWELASRAPHTRQLSSGWPPAAPEADAEVEPQADAEIEASLRSAPPIPFRPPSRIAVCPVHMEHRLRVWQSAHKHHSLRDRGKWAAAALEHTTYVLYSDYQILCCQLPFALYCVELADGFHFHSQTDRHTHLRAECSLSLCANRIKCAQWIGAQVGAADAMARYERERRSPRGFHCVRDVLGYLVVSLRLSALKWSAGLRLAGDARHSSALERLPAGHRHRRGRRTHAIILHIPLIV